MQPYTQLALTAARPGSPGRARRARRVLDGRGVVLRVRDAPAGGWTSRPRSLRAFDTEIESLFPEHCARHEAHEPKRVVYVGDITAHGDASSTPAPARARS